MTETLETTPKTLHRGIVLSPDELSTDILDVDLVPGSVPKIDEQGRKTVHDGNEYGVYMSSNDKVAEMYSSPNYGDIMPDSPVFYDQNGHNVGVMSPRVGVQYEIDAEDLETKKPFVEVTSYNNGFGGDEYITDVVPKENHRIIAVRVGPDTLHKSTATFEVGDNPEKAIEDAKEEATRRIGRVVLLSQALTELTPEQRKNRYIVEKIIAGFNA